MTLRINCFSSVAYKTENFVDLVAFEFYADTE